MEIILCRHGETEWSLSGRHTGKTDIPLTAKGSSQGESVRKKLKELKPEKIFCSPRKRALDTVAGLDVVIEPLAAEWDYGDFEGLTTEQIHQKSPKWNLFIAGAPHGETPEQVGRRADELLKKCKGRVAIVSHGHFLRVFAARFLGLGPREGRFFFLSVASVSILSYEREQPVIRLWNEGLG
jgi:broad specificity phosphatase PhoE